VRVVTFGKMVQASPEFVESDRALADRYAREIIERSFAELRGPRGGRYEAVEPIKHQVPVLAHLDPFDPFSRLNYYYRARVRARYMRPGR
jgi:hypothetical protein